MVFGSIALFRHATFFNKIAIKWGTGAKACACLDSAVRRKAVALSYGSVRGHLGGQTLLH